MRLQDIAGPPGTAEHQDIQDTVERLDAADFRDIAGHQATAVPLDTVASPGLAEPLDIQGLPDIAGHQDTAVIAGPLDTVEFQDSVVPTAPREKAVTAELLAIADTAEHLDFLERQDIVEHLVILELLDTAGLLGTAARQATPGHLAIVVRQDTPERQDIPDTAVLLDIQDQVDTVEHLVFQD